ncbi:MAG TPA: PAS domain S-box protein [Gemmatimonadales bacterium]|nr:PAS domain S-box protein [Gemmatimonadales bacterium]
MKRSAPRKVSKPKVPKSQGATLLRAVVDSIPMGVLVWGVDGKLQFANRRAAEIAGRPFQPGQTPTQIVATHQILRSGTRQPYPAELFSSQQLQTGEPTPFTDAEIQLPDGRRRHVEGWTSYSVTAFADVTERRSAEAISAADSRVLEMVAADAPLDRILDALVRAFEALADGMLASILLVEDGVRVRHGAAPSLPEEWIRLVDGQPIGPNEGSCGAAAYLKEPVIAGDIATDPRWVRYRDAALACGLRASWSVPIMGPDQAVLGTFALYFSQPREPTPRLIELATQASHVAAAAIQRHRDREVMRASEARARLIVEHALDASVQMDSDGVVTGWNARATAIFGWTLEEVVGHKLATLIIPPPYRAHHEEGLRRYLASGVGPILNRRIQITALHRDGHEFPVELSVTPIITSDRVMFSAFIEDITAAKQAEEALRESKEHLSLVYDHVDDVLFHLQVEPQGYRFVSVNPAFTVVTGLEQQHVIGKLIQEVIPEPSRSLVLGKYAEAIRTQKTVRWEETTPYPSGTRHGDVAITPVFDAQGQPKYLIGSVRDVTERRRMEEQVRQLQKLEAVGQLSGGIAHDFNNILGVIVGVGNMLRNDVKEPDQRGQIEEILQAGERGAALTRQFLAFGRKQVLQPRILDLNAGLKDLEKMLRRLIREDIALSLELDPALWRIKADPGQVEQVVTNLVVNARDAMPHGGRLIIATSNVSLDAEFAKTHVSTVPGPYVRIVISDTGHGMDEETQKRVFEPFFTTKEVGKGTGLGLATVYGIVKQSGGNIWVTSTPGQGTTFTVYFPRSTEELSAVPEPSARISGGRAIGDTHILLVEDEPALRRAIERMLARLEYRVTVAASGDEALDAVASQRLKPDVLLTDMVMPGMKTGELVERLLAIQPNVKVLRMSGYTAEEVASPASPESGTPFLRKPFSVDELAAAVQAVLDSGR